MKINEKDQIKFFSFQSFDDSKVAQGIFTRQGGVSPAPWHSLNTGGMNGDLRENVIENRHRIFNTVYRPVESIYDVWQVHSKKVICTDSPRPLNEAHIKADAIITDRPEVTLFMRFGDCVPIFFYDPFKKVIAIAHAGWQGTILKITKEVVLAMKERYECKPENIITGIGPSICAHHYQVGMDVIERVNQEMSGDAKDVLIQNNGKTYFDLWNANKIILNQSGIRENHIEIGGVCTAENLDDWYSHRAEHGKTGRFGALLGIK